MFMENVFKAIALHLGHCGQGLSAALLSGAGGMSSNVVMLLHH